MRLLARALAPYLRDELGLEQQPTPVGWMTHRDTPTPRLTMRACRDGRIAGARKLGRKWVFDAQAWEQFVRGHGEEPSGRVAKETCAVASGHDATLEALREELGLAPVSVHNQRRGK